MIIPNIYTLKEHFERELKKAIERPCKTKDFYSKRLYESIAYALSSPAKRIRPLLVLSVSLAHNQQRSFGQVLKLAMPAALAVEFIHTYSLIHDDLPAMDNDDFRRGRQTLHRRYDEALAILAGDALLADAFVFAASSPNPKSICLSLAKMAGSKGLVAGQSEDLFFGNMHNDADRWYAINEAKTAKMFESCAETGILSIDSDKKAIAYARSYGQMFGVAFQIYDDLKDQTGLASVVKTSVLKELLNQKIAQAKDLAKMFANPDSPLALIRETFKTIS